MDIRQQLRSSLELRVARNELLSACLGIALAMVFTLFRYPHRAEPIYRTILIVTAVSVLVPVSLIYLCRRARILRQPDGYILCQAALDQPHRTLWRGDSVYYSVVLEDPVYGCKYQVNTRAIFRRRSLIGPTAEEYTNRIITIAYNRATDTVVVIG